MGPIRWGYDVVKVVSWYDNERGYSCRVAYPLNFLENKGLEAAAARPAMMLTAVENGGAGRSKMVPLGGVDLP